MQIMKLQILGLLTAVVLPALASPCAGQVSELMRFDTTPFNVESGIRQGEDGPLHNAAGDKNLANAFSTFVQSPDVNLIRVHFSAFDLGEHSELRLMSVTDGAMQRFTHQSLEQWNGWSAIFNGDAVIVQLLVAPGERVSFTIDQLAVNDPQIDGAPGGVDLTLCGPDNRIASTDSRVGRLSGTNCGDGGGCGGCTAWLTSIGSAITAGHCGNGPGGLIEFNVPMSDSDGTPNAADPSDQYPVGMSFYAFQDGGVGFDWAIMNVGVNSNTGLRAHWVQGYFHLTPNLPTDDTLVRVKGYGVDNSPMGSDPTDCCATNSSGNCTHFGCNANSLTLQTAIGPKDDDDTNWVSYQVDTEPANSGSPVMYASTEYAFAVHTNGGCESDGGGANFGNRLTQSVMAQFLNEFLGGATFLDNANVSFIDAGTALFPAQTLPQAVNLAPNGGTVAIAGGNYAAASGNTGTFNKAVTLTPVSGVVTIGN